MGRTEEESSGVTLILFTTVAPHSLADELTKEGHEVYEAIAISKVLALAEQNPTATILITAGVDQDRARVVPGESPNHAPETSNHGPGHCVGVSSHVTMHGKQIHLPASSAFCHKLVQSFFEVFLKPDLDALRGIPWLIGHTARR